MSVWGACPLGPGAFLNLLTRVISLTELEEFRARRRQGSPHYTIYLGFGQDLSAGRPKEKSLILVKVEPGLAK